MASVVRFDPPQVEVDAELAWLLTRAFGPATSRQAQPVALDADRVIRLAEAFDLLARVGARTEFSRLCEEIGSDGALQFRDTATETAARSLVIEVVCQELAQVAATVGTPVVLLKGAALQIGGWTIAGSRSMIDVDVLVKPGAARELQNRLVNRGYLEAPFAGSDHQLPCLTHQSGIGVELHFTIPGLRVRDRDFANAQQLIEAGLVEPVSDLGMDVFLPNAHALLAHALVHGIAQHGFVPCSYPMSRMVADVQDLKVDRADWEYFLAGPYRWIAEDVSCAEVEAVAKLVDSLNRGESIEAIAGGGNSSAALLRHVIAGAVDQDYGRALRVQSMVAHPSDRSSLRNAISELVKAVWPSRAQLEIIYGPPKTLLGYWRLRLWRPFDLVCRAWRYGLAAARHRMPRR